MYIDYIKVMAGTDRGKFMRVRLLLKAELLAYLLMRQPQITVWKQVWMPKSMSGKALLAPGSIPPYEGANGISWVTTGVGWFGAGIMSIQPVNLFNFGAGNLKFMIKIPANITFKIGIIDAWNNQNYVTFPANQTTYGLVRNGNWGQASIPAADLRGLYMDLRMLSYEFVILEEQGAQCEFGLDDIYWDGGTSGLSEDTAMLKPFELHHNYPNPFNPETNIGFVIKEASNIKLEIFNLHSQKVKTLISEWKAAGNYSTVWDGTDSDNNPVTSGIYFYKLETARGSELKKCILLK